MVILMHRRLRPKLTILNYIYIICLFIKVYTYINDLFVIYILMTLYTYKYKMSILAFNIT